MRSRLGFPLIFSGFKENLDVKDWKTKHFAKEVLQKSTFAEVGIFMVAGSVFYDFGLGMDFHVDLGLKLVFGTLGGFTLASWGTLGRPWDIEEHKKRYFEVQG